MFPGVDPKEIDKALFKAKKDKENNVEPAKPEVRATYINLYGKFGINFGQEIMLPEAIDQNSWDLLFEV